MSIVGNTIKDFARTAAKIGRQLADEGAIPGLLLTFGYQGATLDDLRELVTKHKALIIDTRYSPHSVAGDKQTWGRFELAQVFGDDYLWVRPFGNPNYNNRYKPITLDDPDGGVEMVQPFIEAGRVLILLCYEADPRACHRTQVAELLADRFGLTVHHWMRGGGSQIALF